MLNRNMIAGLILFGIFAVGGIAASAYLFLAPKQKVVSGMSYYDKPIKVQVNDKSVDVAAYGNYQVLLTTSEPIKMTATDPDGKQILDKTFPVDQKAAVIIEILAPEKTEAQTDFCFVESNVTSIYYVERGQENNKDYVGKAENIVKLATTASKSLFHDLGYFGSVGTNTVYPGRYDIDKLPNSLDSDSSITGYFPVTCEVLDKPEDIRDQIYVWRYFEEEGLNFNDLEE
jgi:hypothetical protein